MPVPEHRPLDDAATLHDLVQRLREGLYVANADGVFVDGNPALLALLGVGSVDELATYSLDELVMDADARRASLRRLVEDGDSQEAELELLRPDGQPCVVLDSVERRRDRATGAVSYHGVMLDLTRRVEMERQLRELSVRDALTGCYNRRYLVEIERRFGEQGVGRWGCVYLDIDGFRAINESCGHARGDEILVRMTRFLLRQVRAEEEVVRMGADDFVIVLANADERRTENVARRLQLAAMRASPAPFAIGWASNKPGETFERTVTRAEQELLSVNVIARQVEHNRREG
ncbi:MAG: GGDEF domain-containing protein [Gemmatimonadaceae bacterium]